MTQIRPYVILTSLAMLVVIPLDWSRLWIQPPDGLDWPLSGYIKWAISGLCSVMAWRALPITPRDGVIFKVLFTLSFLADSAFRLGHVPIGIGIFAVFQALLSWRNLAGASEGWKPEATQRVVKVLIPGLALAAMVIGTVHQAQGVGPLLVGLIVYTLLLLGSLGAAWAATAIGTWPAANARRMALGVSSFVLCDMTVGLALVQKGLPYIVSSSLTWMFYTPALLLIASSAYRENDGA